MVFMFRMLMACINQSGVEVGEIVIVVIVRFVMLRVVSV